MKHEDAKNIGERFVRALETSDPGDVFADDVFCDINVPEWRFQMQGVGAIRQWLSEEQPDGSAVTSWRADATESGALVELEQRFGEDVSRNVNRLDVRDGRVTEWTMYCTGVWTKETQERQGREAPMIRP